MLMEPEKRPRPSVRGEPSRAAEVSGLGTILEERRAGETILEAEATLPAVVHELYQETIFPGPEVTIPGLPQPAPAEPAVEPVAVPALPAAPPAPPSPLPPPPPTRAR